MFFKPQPDGQPDAVFRRLMCVTTVVTGTVVSGMSVLCCSKARLSSKGDAVTTTVCINLCVGAAQLGTVTFLMVGWFWSLAWGIKMVILAGQQCVCVCVCVCEGARARACVCVRTRAFGRNQPLPCQFIYMHTSWAPHLEMNPKRSTMTTIDLSIGILRESVCVCVSWLWFTEICAIQF